MINAKKRGLGKGLNDLGINELLGELTQAVAEPKQHELQKLPIDLLQPGRYQPRREFNPEALEELANSIRSQGIIQPLIVRQTASQRYEIIAGERRWRAAQMVGMQEVPVVIRDIPDEAAMAMALIENIQREDLNAIEEAHALQRLSDEFAMTHEQIAEVVGKSRPTISNLLRLLQLDPEVKMLLEQNKIEMGHGRALLALNPIQQIQIAKQIINKNLSVREVEKLIKQVQNPVVASSHKTKIDPNILSLQKQLSDKLGAAIAIQHLDNGKGKLVIQYNSLDELEGILDHIR